MDERPDSDAWIFVYLWPTSCFVAFVFLFPETVRTQLYRHLNLCAIFSSLTYERHVLIEALGHTVEHVVRS